MNTQDNKTHDPGDTSGQALVDKTDTLEIERAPVANGKKRPTGYLDLPQELRDQICDELERGYDKHTTLVHFRIGNAIALWADCSQSICVPALKRCGASTTFESLHVPWILNLAPRLPNVRSVEIVMLVSIRKYEQTDHFRWPKNTWCHDFKRACLRMENWAMATELPITSMKVYHAGMSSRPGDLNFQAYFDQARQYGAWTKEKGWNSDEDRDFMNRMTSS